MADGGSKTAGGGSRKAIFAGLKLVLAAGIVGYLIHQLNASGAFTRLIHEPKQWGALSAALAFVLGGLSLNYVRWYLLVRALDLPFTLTDAFRLGSLGFLLSQAAPSSVGGDVFKAAYVAHEHPGKRTEAVASVLIDRVVGMFAMMLVATCGQFAAPELARNSTLIRSLATAVTAMTVCGAVGLALLMTPWFTGPAMQQRLAKLPLVGSTLARLTAAAAVYRNDRRYLFAAIGVACCVHFLFVLGFWMIGRGLPVKAPSLAQTCLVGPMSLCASALPLTPGGVGLAEGAMGKMFSEIGLASDDGYLVGIAFRAMMYVMAALGAVYYVSARKSMKEIAGEAEQM